jgi:hypothetical protein
MARKEVAPVLAKYLMLRKLDVDRTIGGKDVLAGYGGGDSGIPWFVVLDAEGRVLADSGKGDQNLGCPYTKEEVVAFGVILRKVATMTEEDWAALEKSLTAQREEQEKRQK